MKQEGVSSGPTAYDKFVQWRYDIKRNRQEIKRAQPLGRRFPNFIQQALALVDVADTMQEVINSLSDEGGLERLGELLNADFTALSDKALQGVFRDQLLPYFRILSHEAVLSSAVLESRHATLLNYLYGIDGKRSVAVFGMAIRALTYVEQLTADFEPCLIALSAVLEVNSSAQVNEDLRTAAELMIALAKEHELSGNSLQFHRKICLRLGLGEHIRKAESKKKQIPRRNATFELAVDQPGELSERGSRHDNDFENIEDIQILPTMGEILGERAEYLPRSDPSTWHLPGISGLLDRQFRLIREDTVGQLRDAAKLELNRMIPSNGQEKAMSHAGARTYSYHNVRLVDVEFDERKGLLCALQFDQPQELKGKTRIKCKDWWEESNRLAPDALIMLLGSDKVAIFLTVAADTPLVGPKSKVAKAGKPIEQRYPRTGDGVAHVVVQLVNRAETDIDTMLLRFGLSDGRLSFSLLEFPGVLLPAFYHTLTALQQMIKSQDIPFAHLLVPNGSTHNGQEAKAVELPAYARRPNFAYDLSTLSTRGDSIKLIVKSPMGTGVLSAQTSLDDAQAEALISTLTRSMALIQGPPGTGKSYTGVAIMKVLMKNKAAAKLGPVICVTFTNHALDQILEHLVDAEVKQVIRIGSRSKSERLIPLNLRTVAQNQDLTKLEKRERYQYRKELERYGKTINATLDGMYNAYSDQCVMAFLKENYPRYHTQLLEPDVDEEGYELVRPKNAPRELQAWLQGAPRAFDLLRESDDLDSFSLDLFSLKIGERRKMHTDWKEEIMSPLRRTLHATIEASEDVKAQLDRIRSEVDLRVLSHANVIGVTTSGLARNLSLLRRLNSKILMVEEAGEVLEAHLLTAMLPSIEHAILIGDHQQLRPKAQNYELSCENPGSQIKLDISLFERLVHPENGQNTAVPYVTLEIQRRMHPSVSNLIRSTLYPDLQDSPQVSHYPEVSGMRRRLFWLDHAQPEDGERERTDTTSHTNQYEVDMVFALVRHLVRQGVYRADDIAVLTPYLGQLRKLRRALSGFAEVIINDRDIDELALEGEENESNVKADTELSARLPPRLEVHKSTLLQALRLATVDNFQGEEAKVVIISLVRCNLQRRCGFLRTSNRINVLLSRAQHGMYIIGNTDTSAHVPMWGQVLDLLDRNGNVGTSLDLCCPRHPKTALQVTTPDDFSIVSPEAGCDLLCGERLLCGHSCVNKCHSDGLHKAVYCTKPCNRVKKGCNHNCQYECGRQCDKKCNVMVSEIDIELPCGHRVDRLPCWQYQDPKKAKCCVMVERTIPGCEHTLKVPCHVDTDSPFFNCSAPCAALLPCGHACNHKCHTCRSRGRTPKGTQISKTEHGICRQRCGRDFTHCQHSCAAPCHGEDPCPLCNAKCEVQCSHTTCSKKCSEPCTPCAEEQCASCCPHSQCNMPCAAPCDWVPCSKRCKELLSCGHQCPSICGAGCPSEKYCQICAPDDIKNLRVDIIMLSSYAEIDLSESPCIFLPCGHIFTVESLDGVMAMSEYYETDPMTGMPTALSGKSKAFSCQEIKTCPDCRSSLRLVPRYGRITRRALLDESTKKFISWSNREYLHFAQTMQDNQVALIESRSRAVLPPGLKINLSHGSHVQMLSRPHVVGKRYRYMSHLCGEIEKFARQTAAEGQPFRRVHDLVEALRRRLLRDGGTLAAFDFDQSLLETRGTLLATALAIRCEIVAVSDFISVFYAEKEQQGRFLTVDFSRDRDSCESLIRSAANDFHILQQTEGHIFWAHLAALECEVMESRDGGSNDNEQLLADIKNAAEKHLDSAEELCTSFPGQTSSVAAEVSDIRRLLRETGYQSQMKMVVAAMQAEFSGTGHWYRCENGHPFTVGECGAPMETTRCPQCNSPIGGANHQAADGVQHAGDIEREFGNMRVRD
jgi:hypothetical protein